MNAPYWLSFSLTVVSISAYHLVQRQLPATINPLFALVLAYVVAIGLSLTLFVTTGGVSTLRAEASKVNLATLLLGLAIVGIEAGYLFMYRAGWTMGTVPLSTSVVVMAILVPIGVVFFSEHPTPTQVGGALLGLVAIFLMTRTGS